MVITRIVNDYSNVYLGRVKGGDAGRPCHRQLRVNSKLRRQRVDVRFDNGKLSVIAKDPNGRDAIVRSGNRYTWTLTGEEFSRLPEVRNTDAPLPPLMIDPTQPMVVTRTVGSHGRVNLGKKVNGGDAGKLCRRTLYVRKGLCDQRVDVRFDNGKLSAIAKGHNGGDIIVQVDDREQPTLTGEEFSRLRGARNTVVAEAVRPAVTDAAENHPEAAVRSDPSEAAGTVIADQRSATPPPTPAGNGLGGGDERADGVVVAFRRSPGPG